MRLHLTVDTDGHLGCALTGGDTEAKVSAWDASEALAGLGAALDRLEAEGCGETFWQQAEGCYRWLFRRDGDKLRTAVLWSTGIVTGWEHVFWSECDYADCLSSCRGEISRVAAPAV